MQDIALNEDNDYFDMFIVDGDFQSLDSMDTAIYVSFLVDQRADASEIPESSLRRGWIGNEQNGDPYFQIGSKIWLLEQSRSIQETLNSAIDYARNCFAWMIEDNLIRDITVTGDIDNDKITLYVIFVRYDNSTFNKQFTLWENTTIA